MNNDVELDCREIAKRADYLLTAYKEGNMDVVKSLLSSLHLWVNSLDDDIFKRIIFTPKEVEG